MTPSRTHPGSRPESAAVAIVGLGGLLPGAPDLGRFWEIVSRGEDTSREAPPGRWLLDPERAFDPGVGTVDHVYSRRACFLDDDLRLDLEGVDLPAGLVESLDPLFGITLHAARQAFHAGRTQHLDPRRMQVVFGNIALPTSHASAASRELLLGHLRGEVAQPPSISPLDRYVAGLPAKLVAQGLGIAGGAFTLDAACASSLYALERAVDALASGDADLVLAGGVSRPDSLYTQMGFCQLHALSPSGRCSPFDHKADGLVVGEGAGLFLLKRLADAERDGDDIHGVIRGIGLSNDIDGGLLAPSREGQLRALRAAYRQAGWHPRDVELIECHATGTPLGDATEVDSLRELWGDGATPGSCVIGSVKSNVGHLLTGAGAAGTLKVLLALRHGQLPPTAHFEAPPSHVDLDSSPFRVLSGAEPWTSRGRPRRAAVNAFGFGGINAHVLVEEWQERARSGVQGYSPSQLANPRPEPVAVVGLDLHFGPWQGRDAVEARLLGGPDEGTEPSRLAPDLDAEGFPLTAITLPLGRFRIPPKEMEEMLPQQLVMLGTAARALDDARWDAASGLRTGAWIGIELDPGTTNYSFRWSRPEAERDEAGAPLTANRVMGSLGGIVASRVAREFKIGGPAFTISCGDASGVRALQVAVRALQEGDVDTALVGGVDIGCDPRQVLAESVLHERKIFGEGATALVLERLSDAQATGKTIYAVVDALSFTSQSTQRRAPGDLVTNPEDPVTIPGVETDLGHCGAATGLAAVAKGILSIAREVLPSDTGPRPWLHDGDSGPRRARVEVISENGEECEILLSAPTAAAAPEARALSTTSRDVLFAVEADDSGSLLEQLDDLEARTGNASTPLPRLGREWSMAHPPDTNRARAVVLLARNRLELLDLIATARRAVETGSVPPPAVGGPRVFFTPDPRGSTGEIAFVFPGSGNHYRDMGRRLALRWPELLREQQRRTGTLRSQMHPEVFWERDGVIDAESSIFGQVTFGTVASDGIRSLGVEPDAVVGYSLGETAGNYALGVWHDRDEMLRRMRATSLFREDLAGPCRAARQTLGIGADAPFEWAVGVVDRSAEEVRPRVQGRRGVYLLIVNTPKECVIGGESNAVRSLVEELGCSWVPLEEITTVHCETVEPVAAAYHDLHLFPTTPPETIRFYSAAQAAPRPPTREAAADSILAQARHGFDYPALIRRAHADGVRTFIELGPGNSCTRMIGRILADEPHLAVAMNVPGRDEVTSFLAGVATLIVHRVPVNHDRLHGEVEVESEARTIELPVNRWPFEPSPRPQPSTPIHRQPAAGPSRAPLPSSSFLPEESSAVTSPLVNQMAATQAARADAQETFLRVARMSTELLEAHTRQHLSLLEQGLANGHALPAMEPRSREATVPGDVHPTPAPPTVTAPAPPELFFDREQCLEFAIGSIGRVLGAEYAPVDAHPTRVRLPDEPLMLVDRILEVEGEPLSLTHGRVVTEHDVLHDGWYLDGDRIPTCIAVEAGQADLFLSGYLGIDFHTKGHAVYRLLDAEVTFHQELPRPGQVIHYDIRIDEFFRQGDTVLFRFGFDGTVNGEPLLTMRNGCAGFFTQTELVAGQGIVHTAFDKKPQPGKLPDDWSPLVPMKVETYSEEQVTALRRGDLVACFGSGFAGLPLERPYTLPEGKMRLVDRVVQLDPQGGRYGIGIIRAELDIHPDDWFLTCHFSDDMVMPGTLMYECCLHTLRIHLLRMGWVGNEGELVYEPVPGVPGQLKCRGQVIPGTRRVTYEVTLKEIAYDPCPQVVVDALMYGDGKPIVEIRNMSLRLSGLTREALESLWAGRKAPAPATTPSPQAPLYDVQSIRAFAIGKPSEAFGEPYRVFDEQRVIARLPGPPYQFLDRVVTVDAEPWQMVAGGVIEAEYDVLPEEWYFAAERTGEMPFAVLLEIALQPCGWFAAYMGSALRSTVDLSFRNLGGKGLQHRPVTASTGTLQTRVKVTGVSSSGGMIIQHYEFSMRDARGPIYDGSTYFGFFTKSALADQVGLRDIQPYAPTDDERTRGRSFPFPVGPHLPIDPIRMMDRIALYVPDGGPEGLGFIQGEKTVDPEEWFFAAHFYQDPVWPGSLGVEAFLQLLKVAAHERGYSTALPLAATEHTWTYRGQVIPADQEVTVQAWVTNLDTGSSTLTGDGLLTVDGRNIYQMQGFTLRLPT